MGLIVCSNINCKALNLLKIQIFLYPFMYNKVMTYIIGAPCVDVLDKACLDVCPVDCIYEAEEHKMMLIDPEECIDCAACEPVCPVQAIFAEEDVPDDPEWEKYTKLNYSYFGQTQ